MRSGHFVFANQCPCVIQHNNKTYLMFNMQFCAAGFQTIWILESQLCLNRSYVTNKNVLILVLQLQLIRKETQIYMEKFKSAFIDCHFIMPGLDTVLGESTFLVVVIVFLNILYASIQKFKFLHKKSLILTKAAFI